MAKISNSNLLFGTSKFKYYATMIIFSYIKDLRSNNKLKKEGNAK